MEIIIGRRTHDIEENGRTRFILEYEIKCKLISRPRPTRPVEQNKKQSDAKCQNLQSPAF